MNRLLLVGVLLLGAAGGARLAAQPAGLSNWRERTLAVEWPGQLLDTLTVVPNSLLLRPAAPATYELRGRYLRWLADPGVDSVRVRYRVLPFRLDATARLIDSSRLERDEAGLVIGTYDPYVRSGLLDNGGRVRTAGSFSRAVSVGNRQDLVLNSAFNLQLDGELGNGIGVSAAITDESLPIQPEGTTQQLREFDRIFIQLRRGRSQLTAGDYELRNPDGYFLRYYKKLEGATLTTGGGDAGAGQWESGASVAVARGQFIRQNITPGEGNQGPYKLTGAGAQRFLIVLAGTERIFLDGELLVRGLDADYVIDYNLAELTFTSRRLITRDSRIVAEYEFADQRYLRTLLAGHARYRSPDNRWTAYTNVYNQQDSRTATGDLPLTAAQRRSLAEAGDRVEGIPVSSVDTLRGRAELRATYELRDTTVNCAGGPRDTTYLLASTDPATARFVATFTDRGPGGGAYEIAPGQNANGRVYRYVGLDPVTCRGRGRFAPVVDLSAPEQQQLLTVGGAYRFGGGDRGGLRLEGSRSKRDLNRFSDRDASDDLGHALRLDADHRLPLGGPDSSGWQLLTRGGYELVERSFTFVNPYRSPEFYRNWNLSDRLSTLNPAPAREEILTAGLGLRRPALGELRYDVERFTRGTGYTGLRHAGQLALATAGWTVDAGLSLLDSRDGAAGRGSFRRPFARLAKRFTRLGGWTLRGGYTGEQSLRRPPAADTLSPLSFAFQRYTLGLAAPRSDRYQLELSAHQRRDELPDGDRLVTSTLAREVSTEGRYVAGRNLTLGGNFTLRDLDVRRRDLARDRPARTFLGRLDLNATALKRAFTSQTTYQVGSGQEPRVEFQYLFVGAGQGQYIWQDSLYNNDGRIQPNEIEISPFPDIADYVRVSVFTDDFIRTDRAGVNQKFTWQPGRLWRRATGARRFLRRLSANTSLSVDRRTRQNDEIQSWNPLQLAVSDSSLIALNLQRRHGLFFNQGDPHYDVQLSNTDRRNRRVLTTGYESSRNEDWTLRFRYRPNDQLSLEAAAVTGRREADSEFFNNKDYKIEFNRLEPSLAWQPGNLRLSTTLTYGREANTLAGGAGESTDRLELDLEGNFRNWLTARLRVVDIALEGDARTPVGFALLQGLQPGRNLLWALGATRQLGEYLQLNLSYEGRRTGEAAPVHVGRAEVTAIF